MLNWETVQNLHHHIEFAIWSQRILSFSKVINAKSLGQAHICGFAKGNQDLTWEPHSNIEASVRKDDVIKNIEFDMKDIFILMWPDFLKQAVVLNQVISHFVIRVQEYYRINQHDYFVLNYNTVLVRTQFL